MQDGVGRLVPGHGLLAEMLVGLGQTLHLAEAGVECHRGVGGVLRHVEVGGTTQLLLDHQRLLQQLQGRSEGSTLNERDASIILVCKYIVEHVRSASIRTLNLLARNLFLISRKLPRFISPLKGSLRMANFTSFWMSCQRA